MVVADKISLGDFSALMLYLTMLSLPVIAMGLAVDWLKRGNVSLKRVQEVMSNIEELDESSLMNIESIESIKFNNVNFSYTKKPLLKDINFEVSKGVSLGLTGKTASGKSALASLMLKFNRTENIYINEVDINLINKNSLRSNILYVPQ